MYYRRKRYYLGIVSTALFSLFGVYSVYADEVSDDFLVNIPISCSITKTVNSAHTATVQLGTYEDEIGETEFNVLCNDSDGFSVYAVGYSGDTYGNTVMVPNSGSSSSSIATGTATSGDTSNWAMKLTAIPGTYAPTLEPGFNTYHSVPNEYTKVASFDSITDAYTGSSFKTTYAAYVTMNQVADTYTGKVKYTVVHPASEAPVGDDRVRVVYDGNGLTFPNNTTKNVVEYANVCSSIEGYIGSSYDEYMTSNISTGGINSGGYSDSEDYYDELNFDGADYIKVVVDYGITAETAEFYVNNFSGTSFGIFDHYENLSGTETFVLPGDTINLGFYSWDTPVEGYDYGFYVKVYPVYSESQGNDSFESIGEICGWQSVSGSYMETTTWHNEWFTNYYEYTDYFYDENSVIQFIIGILEYDDSSLLGSSIRVFAANPYTINYNGNGATGGSTSFNHVLSDLSSEIDLIASNYYKSGYGFAGWSQDSAASVNSNSVIFGPNEIINASDLTFDSNHEATLYAIWVPSSGIMQNYTNSQCLSLAIGDIVALTDSRDNNVYSIAKLADNKCWMIENLRVDNTANITTTNTQSNSGSWGGVFTGLADPETNSYNITTANSLYTTDTNSTGMNIISGVNVKYRFPRFNNHNNMVNGVGIGGVELTETPQRSMYSQGNINYLHWYSYGTYYSWAAAVADTDSYSNDGDTVSTTSICPSGWHLPSSGASGEFADLSVSLGGLRTDMRGDTNPTASTMYKRFLSYPNNFVLSGNHNSMSNNGTWWSSTTYDSFYAYVLYVESGFVSPVSHGASNKYSGNTVRCILD